MREDDRRFFEASVQKSNLPGVLQTAAITQIPARWRPPIQEYVKKLPTRFPARQVTKGLYIHGPKKSGKELAVAAVMVEILRRGCFDAWYEEAEQVQRKYLDRRLKHLAGFENEEPFSDWLRNVGVLTIVHLGVEMPVVEWKAGLSSLLYDRAGWFRPTLLTSLLSPEKFAKLYGEHAVDALEQACYFVQSKA